MQQVIGFAALALSVFDLICICISLGINYWTYLGNDAGKIYAGLWKGCVEVTAYSSGNVCSDVDETTEIKAVRAMLFLGLFLVCGGLICICLKMFVMKDRREILFAAVGSYFMAGLFLMIGFAVYHAKIYKPVYDVNSDYQLHAGFAFCVIAWLVTWVLAGLSAAIAVMKGDNS